MLSQRILNPSCLPFHHTGTAMGKNAGYLPDLNFAPESRSGKIMQLGARCKLKPIHRNYLASFVNVIHLGIVVVSVSGWVWWPTESIEWYLGAMIAIAVQWAAFGNHCILTDFEWWLRTNTRWHNGSSEGFVAAWIRRLGFKWPPVAEQAVPWVVLLGCVALGYYRK
jgi:hypothetical protein